MGAALGDGVAPYYGHMYVTGWETRNLRMASNIMATFRERPGARVLVIVGATHKPWLDKILGQMPNVRIVDAEKVLGAGD
jgi:pheromone shutdown protein TraB